MPTPRRLLRGLFQPLISVMLTMTVGAEHVALSNLFKNPFDTKSTNLSDMTKLVALTLTVMKVQTCNIRLAALYAAAGSRIIQNFLFLFVTSGILRFVFFRMGFTPKLLSSRPARTTIRMLPFSSHSELAALSALSA